MEGRGARDTSAKIRALGLGVREAEGVDVAEPGTLEGLAVLVGVGVDDGCRLGMAVRVAVARGV